MQSKNSFLYKEEKYSIIKYITNEINSFLLILEFFQMQREDKKILFDLEKNFERLDRLDTFLIDIDSTSGEFSLLIEDIFYVCHF